MFDSDAYVTQPFHDVIGSCTASASVQGRPPRRLQSLIDVTVDLQVSGVCYLPRMMTSLSSMPRNVMPYRCPVCVWCPATLGTASAYFFQKNIIYLQD